MKFGSTLSALVLASVASMVAHNPSLAQIATAKPETPMAASAPTPVPALVPYSGIVVAGSGEALAGEASITFLIFKDEQGGEPLFTETQKVAVDSTGHYRVQLGAANPNGLPSDLFSTGEARWLEVQVAGEPEHSRVLLASVPYALKAADAATLGGLPASAFALARPASMVAGAESPAITPNAASNVTTTGGIAGYVPQFSGTSSIVDSPIFVDATGNVDIGTASATTTLDVNGSTILNGYLTLSPTGTGSATNLYPSQYVKFVTSAYNSATQSIVQPRFQLQAEAQFNNTANPTGTLNLLASTPTTPPVETGLYFKSDGTIHFAPGQAFPGTGAITGVTAGTGLTGGGISGNVTLNLNTAQVPLLAANNSFTGNETVSGNVSSTSATGFAVQGVDSSSSGNAIVGNATSTSGFTNGVYGASASQNGNGVQGDNNSTVGGIGVAGVANAATGYSNGVYGRSVSPNGVGVVGTNLATTGPANGVSGATASSSGSAVSGFATSATGYTNGIYGSTASTNGTGVAGYATSTTGAANGVNGTTASPQGVGVQGTNSSSTGGVGVIGVANATSGYTNGVYGKSVSVNGTGVNGQATSTTGSTTGVGGSSASPNGVGVYGVNTSTTGGTGVNGSSNATSGYGNGVFGSSASPTGVGVQGVSTSATGGTGVSGTSNATTGQVYGVSGGTNSTGAGAAGVSGYEGAATGRVYGVAGSTGSAGDFAAGIWGNASATSGITYGTWGGTNSPDGVGALGVSNSTTGGTGVNGVSNATSGYTSGVIGTSVSPAGTGVSGYNNSGSGGNGVFGSAISTGAWSAGVNGVAGPSGTGVNGTSPNVGVTGYAENPCGPSSCPLASGTGGQFAAGAGGLILQGLTGTANIDTHEVFHVDASGNGYFAGNLNVTGNVSKGGGSFKIDDPMDPANKYLSHSFVESPDMMNVYNGNVKTDKFGRATVELPEYFEALNRDFRYQLTVMGQFAQAIVATKIGKNRFVIRTNKPSVEVSWQVTGIRKDAYANANRIPTEEEKPASERGYYLHPELFNQPESKGIMAAHAPDAPSKPVASQPGAGSR